MLEEEFPKIIAETKGIVLKTVGVTLIDRFSDSTEDVVQEVYFRLFKALKKDAFEGRSKLTTYVYTIAKNEANRMNQKRLKEEEKAKRFLTSQKFSNVTLPSSEDWERKDQIETILEKVPLPFRETLRLYLKGKSIEEIQRELLVQPGTVKSRLFRVKQWIQKQNFGVFEL